MSAATSTSQFQRFMLKATVPVIAMKPANWVTMGLAVPNDDRSTPLQDVQSLEVDTTHEIARFLGDRNQINLFNGGREFSVGRSWAPAEVPTGPNVASVVADGPDGAALVAFEKGDALGNPFVDDEDEAIACRVAFPSNSNGGAVLSNAGLALFRGAIEWSLDSSCRSSDSPIRPVISTQMCQTDEADETNFAQDDELVVRGTNDPVNLSSLWVRAVQFAEVNDDPIVFLGGRLQRAYDAPPNRGDALAADGFARPGVFGCNLNDGTVTAFDVPIEVDSLQPAGNGVINERVRALAYDGTWLYIGGRFRISEEVIVEAGLPARLADQNVSLIRVDPATGAIDPTFVPTLSGSVSALTIHGNFLYIGGGIREADGEPAQRLVRMWIGQGAAGRADPDFRPQIEASIGLDGNNPFAVVLALEVIGNNLLVGGSFQSIDGEPRNSLAAFNLGSLELTPFAPSIGDNNVVTDPIPQIKDIVGLADGSVLACGDWWVISPTPGLTWTAYDHDGGEANPNTGEWFGQFSKVQPRPNQFNHGKFNLATGAADMVNGVPWGPVTDGGIQACDYDPRTNMVILGGHYESIGTYVPGFVPAADNDYPDTHEPFEKLTAIDGTTGEILAWDPDIDSIRGLDAVAVVPGVTPDDSEIIVGGALTTADRVPQSGLARFGITDDG